MIQTEKLICIEEINPDERYEKSIKNILNSPRSLEACRRQGIDPADLDPITEDKIREQIAQRERKKNIPNVLIEIRMKHYNEKRKEKIKLLIEERKIIIEEAERGSKYMNSSAGNSMTRTQGIFSKIIQLILGAGASLMLTDRKFASANSFSQQPGASSAMIMSQSAGQMQSAMLEKEKRELEKIKFRQQKDIEQMMEYELKMEQIRQRNEEKLKFQRDKEERRRQEIAKFQKDQEERKRRDEEKKREKMEYEQMEQKRRAEEIYKKEQEKAEKQRLLEIQRKREAIAKEEERRKKQEEFQLQTEKILAEQQREVDKRKAEMEKRDQERRDFMIKKQNEKQKQAAQKRAETEKKIETTKSAGEMALFMQRKQFEEREKKVEEKRRQFESAREKERQDLQKRAMQKQEEIQKVMEQNLIQEEQRKEQIRQQQRLAEERQQKLSQERQRDLEKKKKRLEDKESHSQEVRKQMEVREFSRIDTIKSKREQRESVMAKTQSEKDWQLMIKREYELLRREEKWENVERIAKAQDYHKQKILEKIEYDNSRSSSLRHEKDKLLQTRFQVRREAEKQKQQIMESFETMRKKGKIDNTQLAKLGLSMEVKEDPNETRIAEQDIEAVKERQNKEMKSLLDQEKKAEKDRQAKLSQVQDENEKQRLMKENEAAKAISSDKIAKLQTNHQQELKVLGVQ